MQGFSVIWHTGAICWMIDGATSNPRIFRLNIRRQIHMHRYVGMLLKSIHVYWWFRVWKCQNNAGTFNPYMLNDTLSLYLTAQIQMIMAMLIIIIIIIIIIILIKLNGRNLTVTSLRISNLATVVNCRLLLQTKKLLTCTATIIFSMTLLQGVVSSNSSPLLCYFSS